MRRRGFAWGWIIYVLVIVSLIGFLVIGFKTLNKKRAANIPRNEIIRDVSRVRLYTDGISRTVMFIGGTPSPDVYDITVWSVHWGYSLSIATDLKESEAIWAEKRVTSIDSEVAGHLGYDVWYVIHVHNLSEVDG